MVGYDLITSKKYQETVPGHTMMFGFTPVKIEYEVADIADGVITAMTPDGQEKFFNIHDDPEVGQKLVDEFRANAESGGDQFWIINVVYAPRMVGKKWMANMLVESYKAGTFQQSINQSNKPSNNQQVLTFILFLFSVF